MRHTLLKRTALVVLITFISMIITSEYSYSDSKIKDFEEAKRYYEQEDFDNAIEKLNHFIESTEESNEKEKYKDQLCDAYYYKAKIHFYGKEYEEMEKALRSLYEISSGYNFLLEKDLEFLKKANEIKNRWKKEKQREMVIVKTSSYKKKNKVPWLLVVGGAVILGAVVYLLTKKKIEKKFTLTVSVGEGVEGTPASGTYSYRKGETVNYSYSLKSGYTDLKVKLDGNEVAASGSITMNQDHTLAVTASASTKYTLTVLKKQGVNGTPDSGTYFYNEGDQVSYNYSLQAGYDNLTVTIDGAAAPVSGTITMNRDHNLIASSGQTFSLTVQKGTGVTGTPEGGVYTYSTGETVSYSYGLQSGYSNLVVTLDGNQVPASGNITMNKSYTLTATVAVTPPDQYTLTVTKGAGVSGTPDTGTFTYNQGTSVSYNYSLQSGFKDLVVTLDGNTVGANGTIIMNTNHTLNASSTPIDQYTLTVTRGTGVDGTPGSGTYSYQAGQTLNYNYSLQQGYKDLVVTLDGNNVSASGTVTMNGNHTLIASATPISPQYTLTVTKGAGVNGTPDSGTFTYNQGTVVNYNYTFKTGYQDLVVTLDGNTVSAIGTIIMNSNHTLIATAKKQYTLTVTRGEGVDGTPNAGIGLYADGDIINYSYSLKTGYKDLVVKLDGNTVAASGTITMNRDHTLTASATPTAGKKEKK